MAANPSERRLNKMAWAAMCADGLIYDGHRGSRHYVQLQLGLLLEIAETAEQVAQLAD
jgi:hypothetical protein